MSLTPAVTKDGFAFAAGDFYAEASGHNRHRRATVTELKEHFKSGSDKDHPAHWFEAQLIHYGLQPSKTKSVARMRLFDAVNAGKLVVPSHVKALEAELKKEWTKNDREAKKTAKSMTTAGTSTKTAAAGTKRKADASNVDMTINVGGINITVSANNASSATAKKARTTSTTAASKAVKDSPKPKGTTIKEAAPKTKTSTASKAKPTPVKKAAAASSAAAPSSSAPTSSTPARKQTARRGGISQGPPRGSSASTAAAEASPRPRPIQTARRSAPFLGGRIPSTYNPEPSYESDSPPPPYEDHYPSSSSSSHSDSKSLPPLGLLNGTYDIHSPEAQKQWGIRGSDCSLTLTLSGNALWGEFDLGVVSGVLYFPQRPYASSHESLEFTWRGQEEGDSDMVFYGDRNRGWMRFLGDGRVEGELAYMRIDFEGCRAPGQGTRSAVAAADMRERWDSFTEDEYERRNRARW